MFSFFSEIIQKSDLPLDIINGGFRVVNFSNKSVYIEGFKKIISFENEQICLKMKKGVMKVEGKDLYMKDLSQNTVLVCGDIYRVESL